MDNNKIGLVMACTGSSYGMNLQAFATQYIIEKMGYETEILQVKPDPSIKNVPLDYGLLFYLPKTWIQHKINTKKEIELISDEIHKKNDDMRIEAAQLFRDNHLHNFTKKMYFDELQEYCKKFAAVLIGSDQCWLPGFSFGRKNSLRFVPDGVKRISYSTSLGVSSFPWYCYHSSRKVWRSFSSVSVREEEGKKIINDICGKDFPVELVVDPTYLLSRDEWLNLIPYVKEQNEKYILSFMLGNNVSQQKYIKRFAERKNLKLVSILSNESVSPIDMTYPDEVIVGASPEKFINLIRGAEYVFTDSFHGIAFSVINQKQFFVFYRKRDEAKGKMSRNSRIDNIMRMWGLSNRIINDIDLRTDKSEASLIDYIAVNKVIDEMKSKSFDYLKKALP